MPEHFKVVCIPCKALYKCSALLCFMCTQYKVGHVVCAVFMPLAVISCQGAYTMLVDTTSYNFSAAGNEYELIRFGGLKVKIKHGQKGTFGILKLIGHTAKANQSTVHQHGSSSCLYFSANAHSYALLSLEARSPQCAQQHSETTAIQVSEET